MYKLVLYGLLALGLQAFIFAFLGMVYFNLVLLILSFFVISTACFVTGQVLSIVLKAPANAESSAITALIMFLIFQPATKFSDLFPLALAGVIGVASKYVISYKKQHFLNPAATAAFLSALFLHYYATWWISAGTMLPLVVLVGLLVVRKIKKFHMLVAFLATSFASILLFNLTTGIPYAQLVPQIFNTWPIVFFATIMLTEPATMPGTKKTQVYFAVLVGFLFGANFKIGPLVSTPETALLIGNLVSFFVWPRKKLLLELKEKIQLAPDIYEFVFSPNKKLAFVAGQYLEWTLPHKDVDSRGNRRYFTIASSPTEEDIRLAVRFNTPSSSFKKALQFLRPGDVVYGGQLCGDFTLRPDKPAVFIAGGIGITPFRSIIKYLMDTNNKHQAYLFYMCKKSSDFVFKSIFDQATQKIGLKVFYIVSDGKVKLDEEIRNAVPNCKNANYYISGPSVMVDAYIKILATIQVAKDHIITDYFPGY